MKLKDLEYFVSLVNTQSFTKTAQRFYISQPSISTSLKRLEDYLNTSLIKRNKIQNKFILTDTGKILYDNSIEILDKIKKTENEISNLITHDITVGIPPIIGKIILPYIYNNLNQYNSILNIIEKSGSASLLASIKEQNIPISIIGSKEKKIHEENLEQHFLLEEDFYIMVGSNHKYAGENSLSSKMLTGENFITLGKGYVQNKVFNSWVYENDIEVKNITETSEIRTAESLISSNTGIGLFIEPMMDKNDSLVTIPLIDPPKFYISIVINKNFNHSPEQKRFNSDLIKLLKKKT